MSREYRKQNGIPEHFVLVEAEDGCRYYADPIALNDDYFFPCAKVEDHDSDDSWHTGDKMKILEEKDDE